MEPQPIECHFQNTKVKATIYFDESNDLYYSLHIRSDEFGHIVATSYNVFDPLCRLRGVLESLGYFICCNGARLDAWITRSGKEMGRGKQVYITRKGQPISRKDRVPTLDSTEFAACGTLSDQLEYHLQWMRGIYGIHYLDEGASVPRQAIVESKYSAQGYAYKIEGDFDPKEIAAEEFPEAVSGAWKIDTNGKIIGTFTQRVDLPAPNQIGPCWQHSLP